MPDRIVRGAILLSERVNSLSMGAEVFYRRLMSVVDDFGRTDARSSVLRAALFPLKLSEVTDKDITKWLSECVKYELLKCYSIAGKTYLEIDNFGQRLRAMRSKYPAPDDTCGHLSADDSTLLTDDDKRPLEEESESEVETESETKPKNGELVFPFTSNDFLNTWNILIKEKNWRKKSFSALQASLKKLSQYPESEAIQMMNDSLAGGWQGLFEIKTQNNNGTIIKNGKDQTATKSADYGSGRKPFGKLIK